MFTGKAKQLYDCLYAMTRGAVIPTMSVRISRADLMKKSGIGAKVTLEQNLRRLAASGLVSIKTIGGIQGGNEYTVRLPEEVEQFGTPPRTGASPPSPPSRGENLGTLAPLETRHPSPGLSVEGSVISDEAKTSFKTITEKLDDEAFAPLVDLLKQATTELTGRPPTPGDRERWREFAELIVAELRIAATRTTVSNVPAFLTEHLRRRLWKKEKAQIEAQGREEEAGSARPKRDTSKCPDCGGTGMWYPEGFDKGVARCSHERLAV
jgi:hypothetical protein